MLRQIGFDGDTIRHVCRLICAYRTGEERNTIELQILSDADRLTQLANHDRSETADDLEGIVERDFYTSTGKQRARELYSRPNQTG